MEFPAAKKALHPWWPDARFHVGGLFTHDQTLRCCHEIVTEFFDVALPIASVHGAPPFEWNGGRPFCLYNDGACSYNKISLEKIEKTLRNYDQLGIACNCVFSNHLLEEIDLKNEYGNSILDMLCTYNSSSKNGVILANPLLLHHIRYKFPTLKVISSVINATIYNKKRLLYYTENNGQYDRIVIHPDDNDISYLSQLSPQGMEILINESCLPNCKMREKHYELIAQASREDLTSKAEYSGSAAEKLEQSMKQCKSMPLMKQAGQKQNNLVLSHSQLKAIYNLNFRDFKIQGRKMSKHMLAFELFRYLLEPEIAFPLAYTAFCERIV